MGKCVVRILEEWETLKIVYQANAKDKKEMILKMFEDPLSKPKIQFLNYFSELICDLDILEAYDFPKSPKEKNLYKLWGNFAERIGFKGDFKFCKKFTDNSC